MNDPAKEKIQKTTLIFSSPKGYSEHEEVKEKKEEGDLFSRERDVFKKEELTFI